MSRASRQAWASYVAASCPPSQSSALAEAQQRRALHAAQSASANESGSAWEAWCAAQHEAARGLVALAKVDPSSKVVGRGQVVYTGKALTDYVGHTLVGPPRAVYVEAKHRSGRLHRDGERGAVKDRDGIPRHQREILASATRGGHLALVVVGFTRAAGLLCFAVEWRVLETLWVTRGAVRSVGPDELAGHEARSVYLARWVRA